MSVAPGGEEFINELRVQLKERQEGLRQQVELYSRGGCPLGVLAEVLGVDTIEAAIGVVAAGGQLRVALGNEPERKEAVRAIAENQRKGCVLDLLAFWTAWKIGALPTIEAIVGGVHLCRSTVDRLHARRDSLAASAKDGMRSIAYREGQIVLQEVPPETVQEWLDDLNRMFDWIDEHAQVMPIVVGESLDPASREHLREGHSDIFHGSIVAMQQKLLLVSDDMMIRHAAMAMGCNQTCWTAQLLSVATTEGVVVFDDYVRWLAYLADAGHNYLSLTSHVLVRAFELDILGGKKAHGLFGALSRMIGGPEADPLSHLSVTFGVLARIWREDELSAYREKATALLMRNLIRGRYHDYVELVATIISSLVTNWDFIAFMQIWVLGHFLREQEIWRTAAALRSSAVNTVARRIFRAVLMKSSSPVAISTVLSGSPIRVSITLDPNGKSLPL